MRNISFALCILLMTVFIGCSGGSNTPVMPNQGTISETGQIDSLPLIGGMLSDDGSFNAIGLLGAYELMIDPDKSTAELISQRIPAALGDSWTVSGIGFFTVAPCANCLRIKSVALTAENYFKITFAISHPFDPGVTTLPPTAKNRLDLDVFDLKLIVKPNGVTATSYPLIGKSAYTGIMANNAGYTTEIANLVTDQAALPYALVVDKHANPTAAEWNEFPMGADSAFDILFNLNSITTIQFEMYLTMGYGASAAKKADRLTPKYFNPEFNSKSPWKVVVTPPQGNDPPDMTNTWNDALNTDTFTVKIEVCDWQHGVTTIANPPVNSGDIAFASNVTKVEMEIPGMYSALKSATTPVSGTGSPASPLLYEIAVANENLLPAGEYVGLVKVSDSRVPPSPISGIDHLIDAPDGVTMTNYVIPEYSTYQSFVATVVIGSSPPVCAIVTDPADPSAVPQGDIITFDGSTSTCVNPITTYEWDLDYDGVTFDVDATGVTTDFSTCELISFTVGLRVISDQLLEDICTVDVEIVEDTTIDDWHTDININSTRPLFPAASGSKYIEAYGDHLYVVACQTSTPYLSYFIHSSDRGATWGDPVNIHTQGCTSTTYVYTRPALAVDHTNGHVYVALESNNSGTSTVLQDIWVTRTTDHGATWAPIVKVNTSDPSNTRMDAYPTIDVDYVANPVKIYVGYSDITTAGAYDYYVARSDGNTWTTTWNTVRIDDSAAGSLQSCLQVNPVDQSVGVVWSDPINWATGGTGRLLWDRSTDGGVTWGTDVVVNMYTPSGGTDYGPGEPSLAYNTDTGIAGATHRELDSVNGRREKFTKANNIAGSSWATSIVVDSIFYSGTANWSGCVEAKGDHWVFVSCFWNSTSYYTNFTQSYDDGVNWSTPINIVDGVYGRANCAITFDDCNNVHATWNDSRAGTYIYYDWGS